METRFYLSIWLYHFWHEIAYDLRYNLVRFSSILCYLHSSRRPQYILVCKYT